jgi:hypothetical protein
LDRLLVLLHGLDRRRSGRQHQPPVTLIVAIQEHLHHRTVLADVLHGRVTELTIRNAKDQLMDQALVAVERVLKGISVSSESER